ncbi:MAG TPA: hypothetical protein VK824_10290, partial [Planctomycetota bacterium]|nr:hypothetical protein [Planctomycetota bacterium]
AQAVTADAQGVFVLPRVGAGIVNLVASAAGYFQHECDTVFVSKDQILEGRTIELQPSATLVARVQGPGGVFVDAEVLVWCLDPAPEGSDRLVKLIPSIAGEASAVELPQGRYRLAVVSDPQTGDWELAETLDERHPTAQVATLAAGETREVFLHAGNGP